MTCIYSKTIGIALEEYPTRKCVICHSHSIKKIGRL